MNKINYLICNTKRILYLTFLALAPVIANGQEEPSIKWYGASNFNVAGKLDSTDTSPFQRFPKRLENIVRERVWELSRNSAGLYIDFKTDGTDIGIQYELEDDYSFPHMPATGVSGLDLYTFDKEGEWQWVRGLYNFKDTIAYNFRNIDPIREGSLRAFRLYLPLYNTVKWLKIGINDNFTFQQVEPQVQNPIVVYGTSIVQGACASRPGLAWPTILGRYLDKPVANLGFSGNGKLEVEIIDFIMETTPSLIILDCMANFAEAAEAEERILGSIERIRESNDTVPILLVEHAGYPDGNIQNERQLEYEDLNRATQKAYTYLRSQGVKFLYIIEKDEINLDKESFVDGTHPNDHGMVKYASNMARIISEEIFDRQ